MKNLSNHYSSEDILGAIDGFSNCHLNLNGISLDIFDLALAGWVIKTLKKGYRTVTGRTKVVIHDPKSSSYISFKLPAGAFHWELKEIIHQISLGYDDTVQLKTLSISPLNNQAKTKSLSDYSEAELLDEIILRQTKIPKKRKKPLPVCEIINIEDFIVARLGIEKEMVA